MQRRICLLIIAGFLVASACTRSYTRAVNQDWLTPDKSAPATTSAPSKDEVVGGSTPTGIVVGNTDIRFIQQAGSPAWLPNIMHPQSGCNWMGIGGQVFDAQSVPTKNLVVEVGGKLDGEALNRVSLTGIAPEYGEGGYEVYLSDTPRESSQALWIQIRDLAGTQLSDRLFFDTVENCERNLIIMNFVQAGSRELIRYFLPIVGK